jgi:pyruvate kinase
VALSFIRTAADVLEAQGMIQDHGSTVPLARIETHDALSNIDEIIDGVDGVMVARGDLGVAILLATVPRLQRKANRVGKPVITATHMLGSMQDSPRPTRAEVTDVATMMAAIAADAELFLRRLDKLPEGWRTVLSVLGTISVVQSARFDQLYAARATRMRP